MVWLLKMAAHLWVTFKNVFHTHTHTEERLKLKKIAKFYMDMYIIVVRLIRELTRKVLGQFMSNWFNQVNYFY